MAPPPGYYPPPYALYPRPTNWAVAAAVMLVVGASIALIEAAYIFMIFASVTEYLEPSDPYTSTILLCGTLPVLGGIFGLAGASFSLRRERWAVAMIGAVLLLPGYSIIFGILALVFLSLGKYEFVS